MPVEQREKELERDYHLQMTEDVRKDVGKVCNYSEAIWMEGIEKGIAQGMAQGMAQGIAQGIAQGKAQGIAQGKDIGAYETVLDLVRKKLLSITAAAEQLGITEKAFCKKAGIQQDQ